MKSPIALSFCLSAVVIASSTHAADFKQSKITQVVNEVQIITVDQTRINAEVDDIFKIPDILRTGPASRAELVAKDDTVTRVGANTVFSFDPASRTIDLKEGSLLFHSPHGKGGGSIHTGSATASVLGSTLIVSATPDGGFKVICLEDDVEITLSNGRHQRLSPGQMTFILPGSDHLAPIILFKLDDLTMHSLLVTGFIHPLPSMPLIVREINRQNKMIRSGRVTDTGLLAGNYASPNIVEVIDPNTIQSQVNSQNVKAALGADATINQPSLTSPFIPDPPNHIFLSPTFALVGNDFFANRSFSGFGAHDIYFNTPAASRNPLLVDLSPYAAQYTFDFVAANNLELQGSTTFTGFPIKNSLHLYAGNQITFAPNITLQANLADFQMLSQGAMTLNSDFIYNNIGNVGLSSGSTINLNNTFLQCPGLLTLKAPTAINVIWDTDLHLGPPGANNFVADADNGSVTISSRYSDLSVADTSIQAHFLTLNSGDSILLDASGRTLTATGAGATAKFTAPNLVTINNANLANYGVVNMAAKTINLFNVAFGAGSAV